MRAVMCRALGIPEDLTLEEADEPTAGPGEVKVRVHAAGLNFPDVLMVQGQYQFKPELPFSPGGEFAGEVLAIGEGVTELAPGDRVAGGSGHGAFSEQICVPEKALRKVPDSMDLQTAAAFNTTYGTSYYALKQRAALKPGETLLVLGAGGGVGLAAVELGVAMGARVIAAASTEEKRNVAKQAGAHEVIDYSDGDLKNKVKALTDGKGADVIYDPVGGDLFDQCLRSINWEGRILVIGFAAGDIPKAPINLILLKSCQVVGVFYGAWTGREPGENAVNFAELYEMHAQGKLKPHIGATYPMQDYAAALRALMERRAVGKVVLDMLN